MPDLMALIFLATLVLFIVGALLEWLIRRRLRTRHSEEWEALGSPSLILNNSWSSNRRLNRWLKCEDARDLEDSALDALVSARRMLTWSYFVALAVLAFLVVFRL